MPRTALITVSLAASLAVAACTNADRTAGDGNAAEAAPTRAADFERIEGTPAGGLEDWIAEIEAGLVELPAEAAVDLVVAQRRALDLYVGRQEYIELYWGPQGRLKAAGEALGQAVLEAEGRFHELLVGLSAPPVDTAVVRAQVGELRSRFGRVLELAREAGVVLVPPGDPAAGGRGR